MPPALQPAALIRVKGARQHNLKNLSVDVPRNKLVVVTGLSGSGKSSFAFDTLFAEGQRKYVESLSAYARQFLDRLQKPDVDYIEGLSPAIAIEQRSSAANPRSTIATTTEIYDYLRLLYAAVGKPHDPQTGEPVIRQTAQQIADSILSWPAETRIVVLAPLVEGEIGEFRDVVEKARREGFLRLRVDGEILELGGPEPLRIAKQKSHVIEAVIDRLVIRDGVTTRLSDSVELALKWGRNRMTVMHQASADAPWKDRRFSTDFCNPRTGFTMPRLTPRHFSFNSHLGACPRCHGIGAESLLDPELVVDLSRTLDDGAVRPWRQGTRKMQVYYATLLDGLVTEYQVSREVPVGDLPQGFRDALLFGTGDRAVEFAMGSGEKKSRVRKPFDGVMAQVQRLLETTKSEFTKNRIRAYMSQRLCQECGGARLKREILAVTIERTAGTPLNIRDFCALTVADARSAVDALSLSAGEQAIVSELTREVGQRLHFLDQVGLGYLSLDRESGTLSGGEAQRIRLATQIGSGLAGVMYVLDEPSIGLHQRDNDRLIVTLQQLRDFGNTVIVVEHDEDTIRAADHIIDFGPGAGPLGGQVVAEGSLEDILREEHSLTAQYLSGRAKISVPRRRTPPRAIAPEAGAGSEGWLTLTGCRENNLQNVDVSFPLGCMTCVTGVSGSGKSTLMNDILQRALFRRLHRSRARAGAHDALLGAEQVDKAIVIDQTPIGKTPRSNPATYSGAFGPVRELFSQLPAARIRGYDAGRFSFNVKGGRCEHCQGDGVIKIEMHFLADVYVECEVCRGRRYNRETLEITYKGKNIADVLDMPVDEASRFFRNVPQISEKLEALQDVGLGYLRLGQNGTTLSGGEAQRVKLASELAKRATGRTVYILDEPTTGLHLADIQKLIEVLTKLRDAGNTLMVIEHNLHVIKCADWVIDLGPEGGTGGGRIVAVGTPEDVAGCPSSLTGRYLKGLLR